MSSSDPTERDQEPVDPRGHEGAPPVPLDAPVESAPGDPALTGGASAAEREPIVAPGAPAELTSDDDRPGQSPDAAAEGPPPTSHEGLAPGEAPAVTTTSSRAEDDVPVVVDDVDGSPLPADVAQGGDTQREGVEAPATTAGDDPGGATPDQADAAERAGPAQVADTRATDAVTADGTPVPVDSSVGAVTTTEVADEIAAGDDVATAPAADAAPDVADPDGPEPEVVVVDEERQPLLDALAEHLGDGLVATHVVPGKDVTIRVARDAWVRTAEVCRDVLGMRYFSFLSAIDWMASPYGRSEDGGLAGAGVDAAFVPADPSTFQTGTTGGETRFQLLARLQMPVAPSLGITIKCDVPADDLVVPTWTKVFPGADWHERECFEMFGIEFAGHPNLVKLYLPGEFEGFPLRKDFPLLARDVKPWPGLVDVEPMPGEEPDDEEASVNAGAEET